MNERRMFRYGIPIDDQAHTVLLSHDPVAVAAHDSYVGAYVEFWAETTDGPTVRRNFRVFGTGHPLPDGAKWVGTCARTPEGLVWHLYEVSQP